VHAAGLTLGSHGINKNLRVVGITAANSASVVGTITLIASVDDSTVTFTSGASTFYGVAAQADNGITVDVDISATTGILYLDADYDDSGTADAANTITLTNSTTLTAETILTLEATTGSIVPAGTLTLLAGSGIVLLDSMVSTANGASALVMNSDFESAGDGTLTITAAKTVVSNNSPIVITAWDLDVGGTLTAASKELSIHGSQVDQTIGVGATKKNMWITDNEVGRITATGDLTVGSTSNGDITVDGLADASTDELGRVRLRATRAARHVVFDANPTLFNKGITVQAAGGVVLSTSVTTKNLETVLWTGTGTLTMVTTMTLSTTNQ
jgi:hypothetical protein